MNIGLFANDESNDDPLQVTRSLKDSQRRLEFGEADDIFASIT